MLKILPWAPLTIKIQILMYQTRALTIKPHFIFTDLGLQLSLCPFLYSIWCILFGILFLLSVLSGQIPTDSLIFCPNISVKFFLTFLFPISLWGCTVSQPHCVCVLYACIYNCNRSLIDLSLLLNWGILPFMSLKFLCLVGPVVNVIICFEWMNEGWSSQPPQTRRWIFFCNSLYLYLGYKFVEF